MRGQSGWESRPTLTIATATRSALPQQVNVTLEEISAVASGFVGILQQTPPLFSAKKIKGVPAYKLARKKQEVELEPVEVEVKEFTVLGLSDDLVDFRCRVSSGTYVRSLAHELGQKLGIGAHLASLRRTQVAEFAIEQSHTLEEMGEAAGQGRIEELHSPSAAGPAGDSVGYGHR